MTSVSSISSSSAYTSSTSASSSSTDLDMSDFLTLMCVQLQNQNPLSPTDPNEYMNQLVSYASLGEQTQINEQLGNVTTALASLLAANAVGYVGHTVEAVGKTNALADGQATWNYTLASDASKVAIKITDESGKTVYTTTGETAAGEHSFVWNGKTTSGSTAPDGAYTISITATDAAGNAIDATTNVIGTVTGVDSSSGTVMLQIGDAEVAFANVIAIKS
ncbi:flagellar hook assembly protein FlgD [Blastochloris sulfoviridis]|uniref:Basal-body rod modification protein FlgD n=1 Tax=Blastochloris sulfoviridis TaxID=50712 RepID=A0A5M6I445_9HYPH|nr:FlgD immunoglobulin-like domain containing protein [Blastochloris sulfoviridis]KAA5602558.1 flagellar biosynthesis protein FlgD [Blastochloris sulfoviridis]